MNDPRHPIQRRPPLRDLRLDFGLAIRDRARRALQRVMLRPSVHPLPVILHATDTRCFGPQHCQTFKIGIKALLCPPDRAQHTFDLAQIVRHLFTP